ncbi:MAG: SMC-Scp complex subunit ScpB [Candidatus Micrarchaeia archaeon]|jgi:chromosome segregation and condensation protein ScpB
MAEELSETTQEELNEEKTFTQRKLDPLRVVEAALFLANKPLSYADLALTAKTTVKQARKLCEQLRQQYEENGNAFEVAVDEQAASMELKPAYLAPVAKLSKQVDLTRKGSRILALIAKKGGMLQSELKKYFRGEIYAYVHELKEHNYITAEKKGNTRFLKPTKHFHETFQISEAAQKKEEQTTLPQQQN